ncbi:17 kDa surface antigen precursor [Liberibacter crescens BT-1]|uniref:17 kDa surface antigen n=1 Tax=Liberibacter crescens (strain BT-1) TaxID=1215343 RepID=L0EWA5_LIBCB|nr:hypothetical protein [Liberibacter crescens]AGA65242.1 17 kDa surface antigen precursor [Liberibacter crescens BT-1]
MVFVFLSFVSSIFITSCVFRVPESNISEQSNNYLRALRGGIFGRSGIEVSERDRKKALIAEYNALESSPNGKVVPWSGRNISGQVIAFSPYQVGSENCRQYIHKIFLSDAQVDINGAACRSRNGIWTPLF